MNKGEFLARRALIQTQSCIITHLGRFRSLFSLMNCIGMVYIYINSGRTSMGKFCASDGLFVHRLVSKMVIVCIDWYRSDHPRASNGLFVHRPRIEVM